MSFGFLRVAASFCSVAVKLKLETVTYSHSLQLTDTTV